MRFHFAELSGAAAAQFEFRELHCTGFTTNIEGSYIANSETDPVWHVWVWTGWHIWVPLPGLIQVLGIG